MGIQTRRTYLAHSITWAIVGAILLFFNRPIHDLLWVGDLVVYAVWCLYGFIIFLLSTVNAVRTWRSWPHIRAVCIVPVTTAILWFAGSWVAFAGDRVVGHMRFAMHRAQYDAIVAEVRRTRPAAGSARHDGVRYIVDPGPPTRVAFPQPGGILDNWEGIVWDPTGTMLEARGWIFENGQQQFSAPEEVKRLFGGDVVACDRVDGDYYRCWFT